VLPFAGDDDVLQRFPLLIEVCRADTRQSSFEEIIDALLSQMPNSATTISSQDAYRVLVTKINQLIKKSDIERIGAYLAFAHDSHPEHGEDWKKLEQILSSFGSEKKVLGNEISK
jgi:hypothetical protein